MKDKSAPVMLPIGAASLLVIFVSLLLGVFSLTVLGAAAQDKRAAEASAGAAAAYYTADSEAERILAEIRSGELPAGVKKQGDRYFYTCPITDSLTLEAEIVKDGEGWHIVRCQAVSGAE